jgi:hypothetical protein
MICKKIKKKKGEFNQSFDEPKYCFAVFKDKYKFVLKNKNHD